MHKSRLICFKFLLQSYITIQYITSTFTVPKTLWCWRLKKTCNWTVSLQVCGYPDCCPEAVGLGYRGTNTVKPFRSGSVCQGPQAFARDSYIFPHNLERSCYFAGKIRDLKPKPVEFIKPPFAHRGPAVYLIYLIYICLCLLRLRSSLRITTSKLGDMNSVLTLRWGRGEELKIRQGSQSIVKHSSGTLTYLSEPRRPIWTIRRGLDHILL